MSESCKDLACYKHCLARINQEWPPFLAKRSQRLVQQERYGAAAEKVAENILEDLFTEVLDWSVSDLNNQVGYADLLLSHLGVKYLLTEVKRPGSLKWNRRAVEAALNQARRYADEQKVRCIAISDGDVLYVADNESGVLTDRLFASLSSETTPEHLWWISVHGVYRTLERSNLPVPALPEVDVTPGQEVTVGPEVLLHPKYKIAANCFAYVGDANDPSTWKLPYLNGQGAVDLERLPKAIQCVITNYRGEKVSGIPEKAIPDVLVRLGQAAFAAGKTPQQCHATAQAYQQLTQVLEQLGRSEDIR